jgi:hypothetical protein
MAAVIQTRAQMARGTFSDTLLRNAAGNFMKAIELNGSDPAAYLALAEYNSVLAECALARKEFPQDEIGKGLKNVEHAIRIRGNWGEAFAIRAVLYLQAARAATEESTRRQNTRLASESMQKAFDLNPLLQNKFRAHLKERRL